MTILTELNQKRFLQKQLQNFNEKHEIDEIKNTHLTPVALVLTPTDEEKGGEAVVKWLNSFQEFVEEQIGKKLEYDREKAPMCDFIDGIGYFYFEPVKGS